MKRTQWHDIPPTDHPPEGLPRPITMLTVDLEANTRVHPHDHPWGQFVYASEGVIQVTTPVGRYLAPPEQAVWVPPYLQHEILSLMGAQLASIYIEVQEATRLPEACCVLSVSPLLKQLILEAVTLPREYDWNGEVGRLFRTMRDQVAIAERVPLHLPMPVDSRLLTICDELHANPSDNRTLEEWGNLVGASGRTLTRLFLKETGMGFRDWRQQLRLQKSLHLLSAGESVLSVGLNLGYESSSAFINMFQQQLGVTPGEYLAKSQSRSKDK